MIPPASQQLLVAVYERPGLDLASYADRLGCTYTAAAARLKPLLRGGWVAQSKPRRRVRGRRVRYVLGPDAFPAVLSIEGRPARLVLLDPPAGELEPDRG
jgi:hypothetical protein